MGLLGQVYQFQYNNKESLAAPEYLARDRWSRGYLEGGDSVNHFYQTTRSISVTITDHPFMCRYRWVAHSSAMDGLLGDGIITGA